MAEPRVEAIWRYPVKSLRGEPLEQAEIRSDGIAGDRLVHVLEPSGRVVTSRYRPGLLGLAGSLDANGEPLIDGHRWDSREALRAVRTASAPDVRLVPFAEPDLGQRYDVLPLTVLTDGIVQALGVDYRRFRPNILITGVDGLGERSWPGSVLRIGGALIGVAKPRERCVMTTFDPDTLEQDPGVLRRIVREFDGRVALDCWVIRPGTVLVGDRVEID
jgi:MOSC domain-containing protein